jgi:hydroxymethylglutaryl-CoA lyase
MLDGMGLETGVDLRTLASAGRYITEILERPAQSRVSRALAAKATQT